MTVKIKTMPIAAITPADYNPRIDLQPGDPEYQALEAALDEFDLVEPLIYNERTGHLVGGHQRLKVLIARGDTDVEVSVVDLPIEKEKVLNLALNKTGGTWDSPKLSALLTTLVPLDISLTSTGFTLKEIKRLTNEPTIPDDVQAPAEDEPQVILTIQLTILEYDNIQSDLEGFLEERGIAWKTTMI
jgi:ParB-like chromosome segregation protein Spo0J